MNKSGKDNRRVRITERSLRRALVELLERKDLNEITVRELTELADVSRGTFYVHYTDIYDMVDKIEDELISVLARHIDEAGECGYETLFSIIADFFASAVDDSKLYAILLSGPTAYGFSDKIKRAVKTPILGGLGEMLSEIGVGKEIPVEYFTSFIVNGTTAVLLEWFRHDMDYPADQIARLLAETFTQAKNNIVETLTQ